MLGQATLSGEVNKNKSKVKCEICGREFRLITYGHLKMHGMTFDEYRERFPDALLSSDSYRQKLRDRQPDQSGEKNPMHGKHHTEEAKQNIREARLGTHHTEETKQKIRDNTPHLSGVDHPLYGMTGEKAPMYGRHHTKEARQKMSDNHADVSGEKHPMYGKYHTEATKQLMSENHADVSGENNPNYGKRGEETSMYGKGYLIAGEKNHMYGKHRSKETKQKISEGHLGKHLSEATKQLVSKNHVDVSGKNNPMYGMTGERSPNWKGGISSEPYCIKFDNDLKERVRNFFNRICFICGKNETENGRKLDVHHVNYNKMVCCNDVKPLFVPLCKSCHSKTLKDREYWEEFFIVSLEYLTDSKCFLPKKVDSLLIEENKNEKLRKSK